MIYQAMTWPILMSDGSYASMFIVMTGVQFVHLVLLLIVAIGIVNRGMKGLLDDGNVNHAVLVGYFWYWVIRVLPRLEPGDVGLPLVEPGVRRLRCDRGCGRGHRLCVHLLMEQPPPHHGADDREGRPLRDVDPCGEMTTEASVQLDSEPDQADREADGERHVQPPTLRTTAW